MKTRINQKVQKVGDNKYKIRNLCNSKQIYTMERISKTKVDYFKK